jgi:hypothetical protein
MHASNLMDITQSGTKTEFLTRSWSVGQVRARRSESATQLRQEQRASRVGRSSARSC